MRPLNFQNLTNNHHPIIYTIVIITMTQILITITLLFPVISSYSNGSVRSSCQNSASQHNLIIPSQTKLFERRNLVCLPAGGFPSFEK